MGYKTILLNKILDGVINQRLKGKLHLEMMNHLTSMKSPGTAWSLSIYLCFMHEDFWKGY